VKKTRQNKNLEPRSDLIGTEKALVLPPDFGSRTGAIVFVVGFERRFGSAGVCRLARFQLKRALFVFVGQTGLQD
jgi:hypothetical protein